MDIRRSATTTTLLDGVEPPSLYTTPRLKRELKAIGKTPKDFFGKDMVTATTHSHLGAALPPEIAARYAYARSADLRSRFASEAELLQHLKSPHDIRTLPHYLDGYYHPISDPIFADPSLLSEVAFYSALYTFFMGSRKIVFRTSIKHGDVGDSARNYDSMTHFNAENEFAAYMEGFERAEEFVGKMMNVSLIVCLRRQDPDKAKLALAQVASLRDRFSSDRIVGIDIMGKEEGYKAKAFREVYDLAKEQYGLYLTAHVGEAAFVGAGAILHGTEHLRCDSLGHATSMPRDPRNIYRRRDGLKVSALISALRSPFLKYIEMCLTSNVNCGAHYVHWIDNSRQDARGRPLQDLWPMDPYALYYPDDSLMSFGALVSDGVPNKVIVSDIDGAFTNNTSMPREESLLAANRNLGINAILGRRLYAILYSPGPWELAASQWLESAGEYTQIPEGFVPTRQNFLNFAETLVSQSRLEAQARLHDRLGIDMDLEDMRDFVRSEIEDEEGYVRRKG